MGIELVTSYMPSMPLTLANYESAYECGILAQFINGFCKEFLRLVDEPYPNK